MIIVEKNEGTKIDYEVQDTATKKKITFDDDLTINLAKREEDWAVHIDVCFDEDKNLVLGTAAGRAYVAEIDIPAREYTEEPDPEDPEQIIRTPVPLDLDKVTLSLWSIE
jgi:autotransporter translocation and assembly factor TamB